MFLHYQGEYACFFQLSRCSLQLGTTELRIGRSVLLQLMFICKVFRVQLIIGYCDPSNSNLYILLE